MSADSDLDSVGLCARCELQTVVTSGRGSRFSLCEKSRSDPRFPRYPRIPVLACRGFVPRDADGGARTPAAGRL